jgi:phosphatidylserine/phosphatidylglycerophosphate/cardiolipin synthase-like enzyme
VSDVPWLDQARTAGALLALAADPVAGVDRLVDYLVAPTEERASALRSLGLPPQVADDFRVILPREPDGIRRACELGAAWAVGRVSAAPGISWSPVVTGRDLDRNTFERQTAETLVGLIIGATSSIRLFTPFLDPTGVAVLAHALASATARGVYVSFGFRAAADRENAAAALIQEVATNGVPSLLTVVATPDTEAFPHLKVLAVDGRRAYIGSANFTYAALTYNVEVGALVEGEAVAVYERLLDDLVGVWGDDDTVAS